MRTAAGSVGHRGHPVPAVTPARDWRRAVATDPRLVEGESDQASPAQFCFGANASAAPATPQTIEIVPDQE